MSTQKKRDLIIEFDKKTDSCLRIVSSTDGDGFRDWLSEKAAWLIGIEAEKAPGEETIVDKRMGRDIAITIQLDEKLLKIAEKKAAEQKVTRNVYVAGLLDEYVMDELWGIL